MEDGGKEDKKSGREFPMVGDKVRFDDKCATNVQEMFVGYDMGGLCYKVHFIISIVYIM